MQIIHIIHMFVCNFASCNLRSCIAVANICIYSHFAVVYAFVLHVTCLENYIAEFREEQISKGSQKVKIW